MGVKWKSRGDNVRGRDRIGDAIHGTSLRADGPDGLRDDVGRSCCSSIRDFAGGRPKELAKRKDATKGGEGIIAGREIHSHDIEIERPLLSKIHPTEIGVTKFSEDAEGEHVKEFPKLELTLVASHSNFEACLHRIERRDNEDCECGAEKTVAHVLFDCPYTETCRACTEIAAINACLRWRRSVAEINDNETAEWWIFFSGATEEI
ncbi:hypothetical protein Trydic_g18753 [Trypoxylus dichotomus]